MNSLRQWVDPSEIRSVFLDVGNTLVFLDFRAIAGTFRGGGIHVTPSELERAEYKARRRADRKYGQGGERDRAMSDLYFSWILEAVGVSGPRAAEMLDRLREQNAESNLWRRSPPSLQSALNRIQASGRRLAVISNSDGTCREVLRRVNLLDPLEAVYDSAVVGMEKPDPALFRLALKELGWRPEQTIHVGDLESVDVVGARRAGILPVLVDPFSRKGRLDCPTVRSVVELPTALGIAT